MIGQLCNTKTFLELISSSNHLFVQFLSRYHVTGQVSMANSLLSLSLWLIERQDERVYPQNLVINLLLLFHLLPNSLLHCLPHNDSSSRIHSRVSSMFLVWHEKSDANRLLWESSYHYLCLSTSVSLFGSLILLLVRDDQMIMILFLSRKGPLSCVVIASYDQPHQKVLPFFIVYLNGIRRASSLIDLWCLPLQSILVTLLSQFYVNC